MRNALTEHILIPMEGAAPTTSPGGTGFPDWSNIMTTIAKITLNGQNHYNFGADCSEADAAGYREWIAEELAEKFPGAEIEINEADSTYSVVVEIDDESDYDAARGLKDDVNVFCMDAWDRCPWNWVS